jgi:hypothetical protein
VYGALRDSIPFRSSTAVCTQPWRTFGWYLDQWVRRVRLKIRVAEKFTINPAVTRSFNSGFAGSNQGPAMPIISMLISCDPEVRIAVVAADGSEILVVARDGPTPSQSLHL